MKKLNSLENTFRLSNSILSSQPSYMVLFVTAVCNARCDFCFYWEEIESAKARLELKLDDYKKISSKLSHLFYLSIGGGEPFIRKDLPEIVELFYKNSKTRVVTISTNGGFPERVKNYIEYLTKNCPKIQLRIQISLDHLEEEHDRSRKVKGLFKKLLKTSKIISEKRDRGHSIFLSIATVITKDNKHDLCELRKFIEQNIDYDDLSLIYPRGNAKDQDLLDVSLEEYRKARDNFNANKSKISLFAKMYRSIDRMAKDGIEKYIDKGPSAYPWECVAGDKMITLGEKGQLYPCEIISDLIGESEALIGNVSEFNWNIPKALNSAKAKKIRNHIVKSRCSCSFECAALCNTVLKKSNWPKIIKNALMEDPIINHD